MTTLTVFINHGRMMATCPRCHNTHIIDRVQTTLICPACWNGLKAEKLVQDLYGAWVLAPHTQLIDDTVLQAREAGEEYELGLPDPQIMNILRARPVENINWLPGETIEQLIQENIDHGLEGA